MQPSPAPGRQLPQEGRNAVRVPNLGARSGRAHGRTGRAAAVPLTVVVPVLGAGQKVAEGLAIVAVLAALTIELPFWAVFPCLTAVNLSTMASVTPANVGIYEASALLAFRAAGVPLEVGLGIAALQHVAYLIPMAEVGWVGLAVTGLKRAEVLPGTEAGSRRRG